MKITAVKRYHENQGHGKKMSKLRQRFVTTVATGGRVKFVPVMYDFSKYKAFFCIICVEVQVLHPTNVVV